ncbi:hypothetical protein [Variovorax sp. HW608]|uniref:hypothetical protein n=1 Tax=Variovorax sp. HW608 TaxID=1034889 RepID=UPI0012FD5B96|nr:hypothetical protein [Variovorax sp. HW608]
MLATKTSSATNDAAQQWTRHDILWISLNYRVNPESVRNLEKSSRVHLNLPEIRFSIERRETCRVD